MMPCRTRFVAPLLISALLASGLWAQKGDRPGEIQKALPNHIKAPPAPVLSPAEELKTFKLQPGFHAELIAQDPLVGDPIAMVFGPDGRLWVVEMRAYMEDIDATGEKEPLGVIAVLDDTNGDGVMDKRTIFLDHLVLPRALSLVGDGLMVAEPPHLWYARDTNHDGVADSKVEIASDYGGTGNPEHMANGLVWMMDNGIYSANHTTVYRYDSAGKFSSTPTITRGQWGITQDDTGRIYYNSNSDPLRMDAFSDTYLHRNPNLSAPTGTNFQLAPEKLPVWPGRVTPGVNRGYNTLRPDGTLAAVTAACSPVIYRGALFPEEFHGDAFICEPAGNLVKRIRLADNNGALRGTNAYEKGEFLTSTDERFRPVSAYNGPDGALWIVDMYRGVIQHRTYVTSYLRAQVKSRDLEKGRGYGRIWRIVPDGAPPYAKPALDRASVPELVKALGSANGWVRDTAQRLLVERVDVAAVQLLRDVVLKATTKDNPLARLHALWTLAGFPTDSLDRATLLAALNDPDPRICAAAIRLAEKRLVAPGDPEVLAKVIELAARSEPDVRLQLALSLGEARTAEAYAALRQLVIKAGQQPFLADAVVSGAGGHEIEFIDALVKETQDENHANVAPALVAATAAVLKSGDVSRISHVLDLTGPAAPSWTRAAVLDGFEHFLPRRADGAKVAGVLPVEPKPIIALAAQPQSPENQQATKLVKLLRWPGKPGAVADVKLTTEETVLFEKGRAQYTALCANCHQPTGQGLAGLAPPLLNSRWVMGPDQLLARIVLCGKADENLVMPTLRSALDDETVAGTLTYIRNSWGQTAPAVKVATVAKVRAETQKHEEPFNEDELIELLKGLSPETSH